MRPSTIASISILLVLAAEGAGCGVASEPTPAADVGVTAATALDPTGTWYGCGLTLALHDDGTARLDDLRQACTGTGRFTTHDDVLEVRWDASCGMPASRTFRGVRVLSTLTLVDLASGDVVHLVDDGVARSLWQLDASDGSTHSTTLALLDVSSTGQNGCYWSTDGECGGLFSCGGWVSDWAVDDTTFHVTTACGGTCPCGAVSDGSPGAAGTFDGHFSGVNCERSFSGTFTAHRLPW